MLSHYLQAPLRFFSDVSVEVLYHAREANQASELELSAELQKPQKG